MQLRIEAQGKYLQKIIEEQQKLGSTLRASETLSSSSNDKQDPSQSEPSGDASAGILSPHKKQRIDDGSKDGFTAYRDPTTSGQKTDFVVSQLDPNLYGDDAGFGYNLETEFKRD